MLYKCVDVQNRAVFVTGASRVIELTHMHGDVEVYLYTGLSWIHRGNTADESWSAQSWRRHI